MRKIKFRGFSKENKWVYGDLVTNYGDSPYRISDWEDGEIHEVAKESVGQYLGLKDKNGKEIYEGDIIKYKNEAYEVKYDNATVSFIVKNDGGWSLGGSGWRKVEVIGNIMKTRSC